MDESAAEVKVIPAKEIAEFKKGADKHKQNTKTTHPIRRFNTGEHPIDDKTGELSKRPTDPKEGNREPFHPAANNAAGVEADKQRLTDKIAHTEDEQERRELERVRDEMVVEELKPTATGMTPEGDFEREIPPTHEFEYTDPITNEKQKIRYVLYNWPKDWDARDHDIPITVSFPTYNTRSDQNSTQSVRDGEIAAQRPDGPMIAIMHPGMGSDKLTKTQRKELKTDQSYSSIADSQIDLLKSLGINHEDKVDVIGSTLGAFAGLAFAARATSEDFTINKLSLTSLPGVEKRKIVDLGIAMLGSNSSLPVAWSVPFAPEMYQAALLDRPWIRQQLEGVAWLGKMIKNDPLLYLFPYAQAMAQDTAADRIKQVLNKHAQSQITLVAGTEDQVSRKQGIYSTLDRVHKEGFENNRIGAIYLPGENLTAGEHPYRHAGDVDLTLQ